MQKKADRMQAFELKEIENAEKVSQRPNKRTFKVHTFMLTNLKTLLDYRCKRTRKCDDRNGTVRSHSHVLPSRDDSLTRCARVGVLRDLLEVIYAAVIVLLF